MEQQLRLCKKCGNAIKWIKDPINDKWIQLEYDCDLEYDSLEDVDMNEVALWRHKCVSVLKCKKGCDICIYFDHKQKSVSGKLIPTEVATHENHTCSVRQDFLNSYSAYQMIYQITNIFGNCVLLCRSLLLSHCYLLF